MLHVQDVTSLGLFFYQEQALTLTVDIVVLSADQRRVLGKPTSTLMDKSCNVERTASLSISVTLTQVLVSNICTHTSAHMSTVCSINHVFIASRVSPIVFYCTCVYAVTCEEEASVPLPKGLALVEDFVSPEEEALLLAAVDWSHTNDDVTGERLHIVFY